MVLLIAVLVAAGTLLVIVVPSLRFAFVSPQLHVGIETAAALIAVFAAFLLVGRFQLSGRVSDLALVGALVVLAITNLAFSTIPALAGEVPSAFQTWSRPAGRLVSAGAFAIAAFAPDIRLARPRRAAGWLLVGVAGVMVTIAGVTAALAPQLPAVGSGLTLEAAREPQFEGPTGFFVLETLAMVMFAIAAVGLTRRAERTGDELLGWFAIGATVAAFSRLNHLLFPVTHSEWVLTGDILRLCFYLVLLVGALREIRAYQRRLAVAAVFEERRRMARDLHDGLAQELSFISLQGRRLAGEVGGPRTESIVTAAERALEEARDAIAVLSRRSDDPLDEMISEVTEQLTRRAGARLRLDLDTDVRLPADKRDSLLRIVREAVTNGVRHGNADQISVTLRADEGIRLRVADNGRGFVADANGTSARNGFGLVSMQERARALGGALRVRSLPGRGTEVEVTLP